MGAVWRSDHPVHIVVEPGTYREVVRIWPGADDLTIRGATGDAEDVVITYDIAAGQQKFYGDDTFGHTGSPTVSVLADDITLRDVTVENAYDEDANGGSQALALRTVGDRIVLDGVRLLGNQDTYLAGPGDDTISRVYATDSYIGGDVDFVYGGGTLVVEVSEIHSFDRGSDSTNGYVAALATVPGSHGLLSPAPGSRPRRRTGRSRSAAHGTRAATRTWTRRSWCGTPGSARTSARRRGRT